METNYKYCIAVILTYYATAFSLIWETPAMLYTYVVMFFMVNIVHFIQEAQDLILKTQVEDKRLHLDNSKALDGPIKATKVPPPPILLSRTDTTMVFKPAPFNPASGEKVIHAIFLKPNS